MDGTLTEPAAIAAELRRLADRIALTGEPPAGGHLVDRSIDRLIRLGSKSSCLRLPRVELRGFVADVFDPATDVAEAKRRLDDRLGAVIPQSSLYRFARDIRVACDTLDRGLSLAEARRELRQGRMKSA